jgi:hypothetical protein
MFCSGPIESLSPIMPALLRSALVCRSSHTGGEAVMVIEVAFHIWGLADHLRGEVTVGNPIEDRGRTNLVPKG